MVSLVRQRVVDAPQRTRLSQPFWDGCALGELRFLRCDTCGRALSVPTPRCRSCLSDRLRWEVSAGSGVLYSYSVVLRPPRPSFDVPYAAAIVRLHERFDVVTNVVDCDSDDLFIGVGVRVMFHSTGDITLPYFVLDDASKGPNCREG